MCRVIGIWLLGLSIPFTFLANFSGNKAALSAGEKGFPVIDFKNFITDELVVIPRVNDLVHDKIAKFEGGIYKLTPKGINLAKIFNTYRNFLKLKDKGG